MLTVLSTKLHFKILLMCDLNYFTPSFLFCFDFTNQEGKIPKMSCLKEKGPLYRKKRRRKRDDTEDSEKQAAGLKQDADEEDYSSPSAPRQHIQKNPSLQLMLSCSIPSTKLLCWGKRVHANVSDPPHHWSSIETVSWKHLPMWTSPQIALMAASRRLKTAINDLVDW